MREMKRPKKNSLFDDELEVLPERFSYMDGFRLGFGVFVAFVLGSALVAGLAYATIRLFKL